VCSKGTAEGRFEIQKGADNCLLVGILVFKNGFYFSSLFP
jgi:hypothetical protein